MKCPKCSAANRDERRFCGKCGTQLLNLCPSCGFANEPECHYCGGCGRPPSEERTESVDTAPAKEDSQLQELLEAGAQQTATETKRDKKAPKQSVTQSDIDHLFKQSKS